MSQNRVAAARQHASEGRISEAVGILQIAGAAGDSEAWAELAAWHLRGDVIERDLGAARGCLKRATAIGHVDAALLEIALTANGSGAPANWSQALALLKQAAETDSVASEHLLLLNKMNITPDGAPNGLSSPDTLSTTPLIKHFKAFCTVGEAEHLASTAFELLEPATVVDSKTGRHIAHPVRTAHNAAIGPTRETMVVQAINHRIAAATGTLVSQGEPLTLLRYTPGQEYKLHLDTLPRASNQRVMTAILYLNDGYVGGETHFPLAGVKLRARAGDLLVFSNTDSSGNPDVHARHAGLPVQKGVKWIATRWIRGRPLNPWSLSLDAQAAGS